uniref:Uncharacterized protein n=1 Tax=Manihot esculenta TaxID=3983 RepID=A0A2C9W2L8_MANES
MYMPFMLARKLWAVLLIWFYVYEIFVRSLIYIYDLRWVGISN